MKKWNASVTLTLNIDYEGIEAETEEEAMKIAEEKAYEDVDFNNCNCSDDASAYVWEQDDEESMPCTEPPEARVYLVAGGGCKHLFHEGSKKECEDLCEIYGWEFKDENEFVWSMEIDELD